MNAIECIIRRTDMPRNPYAMGYGKKIPTSVMVYHLGRWRRVYCTCYSNAGSLWINVRGVRVGVRDIFQGDKTAELYTA